MKGDWERGRHIAKEMWSMLLGHKGLTCIPSLCLGAVTPSGCLPILFYIQLPSLLGGG